MIKIKPHDEILKQLKRHKHFDCPYCGEYMCNTKETLEKHYENCQEYEEYGGEDFADMELRQTIKKWRSKSIKDKKYVEWWSESLLEIYQNIANDLERHHGITISPSTSSYVHGTMMMCYEYDEYAPEHSEYKTYLKEQRKERVRRMNMDWFIDPSEYT